MRRTTMVIVAVAWLPTGPLAAQHATPYAGQETRAVKALSADETRDLLGGNGMGLAKAAELNGYPGPRHVLDLAKELALTADQARAIQEVHGRMNGEAVAVGGAILEREQALDRLFATRAIDEVKLAALTGEIGGLSGRLRAAHLKAHLETTALLDRRQVHLYGQLRGYGADASGAHKH